MLRITSPQIATRSDSRKKITSPRPCPGAWTTRKPATSSPSRSARSTLCGGPFPDSPDDPVDRVPGRRLLHRPASLHRVDVIDVAGERDAAGFADVLGDSLVVGVDVGERDHRDLAPLDLAEDPAAVPAPAGVDQHVLGEIDVDARRRELLEAPDAWGQVLQCAMPSVPRGSPLCSASSSSLAIVLSPSTRAGWSAGSGSISRRTRLRTWSAKWGVEAPARARMSSAVISSGRREQLRALGLAHGPPPILVSSARLSISACWFTSMASWSPITHTWL